MWPKGEERKSFKYNDLNINVVAPEGFEPYGNYEYLGSRHLDSAGEINDRGNALNAIKHHNSKLAEESETTPK